MLFPTFTADVVFSLFFFVLSSSILTAGMKENRIIVRKRNVRFFVRSVEQREEKKITNEIGNINFGKHTVALFFLPKHFAC